MKILRFVAIAASFSISGLSVAQATILTFEDLNPSPALYDVMPVPYNSLTFSGWFYGPDTVYTPASGIIDLFTNYADPNDPGAFVVTDANNQVTRATPFIFSGAAFSGYSGVTFELWLAGLLVHTSNTLADAPGIDPYLPTFLASGYAGTVDKVVVSGVQGYYAMDDFSFREATTTSIPEPSTGMLTLLAIGGVLLTRKRMI